MKNAHEFEGLYDDLFDFPKAGYVMIDVATPFDQGVPDSVKALEYVSPNPDMYWMKGLTNRWHVTARGPLDPRVRQSHCKQVLEAVELPKYLTLGDIAVFPSPYPEEQYDCIVMHVEDDALFEINAQLAVLPGVQTYIPYLPHITLGYFQSGHTDFLTDTLWDITDYTVDVLGYDFGRMQP